MAIMSFLSNLSLGLNKEGITGCGLKMYFLDWSKGFGHYWVELRKSEGMFFEAFMLLLGGFPFRKFVLRLTCLRFSCGPQS